MKYALILWLTAAPTLPVAHPEGSLVYVPVETIALCQLALGHLKQKAKNVDGMCVMVKDFDR
jgi:hypothetical protein